MPLSGCVKSRVLWRLVEAASFRVVVCWFSACCGVMPPRARWGRRVLYQWTQAAVSCVGFQSGWFPSNVARNSRAHISDIEMWSLELQRLWPISKNDRVKLRATFAGVVTVVTFRSHYSPGVVPGDPGGGFAFACFSTCPGRDRIVYGASSWFPNNVACNFAVSLLCIEIVSLQFQRFWVMGKVRSTELHATFGRAAQRLPLNRTCPGLVRGGAALASSRATAEAVFGVSA